MTVDDTKPTKLGETRKIAIVYPDHVIHPIIAEYVQMTEDGKYILNYVDLYKSRCTPSYTELSFINGEWAKCPFHKSYDEYKFKIFDQTLSDDIIKQLPENLFFRILIKDSNKEYELREKRDTQEDINKTLGAKVVGNSPLEQTHFLYMVLPVNDKESSIRKNADGVEYNFEMPFPIFTLPYEVSHNAYESTSYDDINCDLIFDQYEYSRGEVPESVRKAVQEFLKNRPGETFDIRSLPIFEHTEPNGVKYVICFVSCADIKKYDDLFNAESVATDKDMPYPFLYDADLEAAIHDEIPCAITRTDGKVVYNDVRHEASNKAKY